jgi:hypothetical protein
MDDLRPEGDMNHQSDKNQVHEVRPRGQEPQRPWEESGPWRAVAPGDSTFDRHGLTALAALQAATHPVQAHTLLGAGNCKEFSKKLSTQVCPPGQWLPPGGTKPLGCGLF